MASVEWTFMLMNLIPGKGQQFIDSLLAKVLPATTAHGFQSIASEESPALPTALRLQWQTQDGDERFVLAQRVLLIRFHVKLLLFLVTALLMLSILIIMPPFAFFMVFAFALIYVLVLCSYTAMASWLIITNKGIVVATPNWRHRWLVHLNLLIPGLAHLFSPLHQTYTLTRYSASRISRIETPSFGDGSCKLMLDYSAGMHVLQDAVIMDHFAGVLYIRNALAKLSKREVNADVEAGAGQGSAPAHLSDEIRPNHPEAASSSGHMD